MNLTMGGSSFCFHGNSWAVKFLPQLPTHLTPLSQWVYFQQISTQTLPTITIQPQQPNKNNPLHGPRTFTLLLALGRYAAPALPHNLPSSPPPQPKAHLLHLIAVAYFMAIDTSFHPLSFRATNIGHIKPGGFGYKQWMY